MEAANIPKPRAGGRENVAFSGRPDKNWLLGGRHWARFLFISREFMLI